MLQSHFKAGLSGAWLPDASGCFSTSCHQQSLVRKKRNDKVEPWRICHFLSRDNKCKLPCLIGWLHARSARRNFCLAITSNSWLVKVSQYDINVWVFLVCVCVAFCVNALCWSAVTLLLFCVVLSFFFGSFLFSFFFFFIFSFFPFFHFFIFFILFIPYIFSIFLSFSLLFPL